MSAEPHAAEGDRTREAAADPWVAREPRLGPTLRRVLARAARRPALPLLLAALATALLVTARVLARPTYVATLTFRLAEGDLQDPSNAPKPPARIREYVTAVALTRDRLLALMEEHGISARLRQANPTAAVKSLRDDLDVTVVRNYFLLDRASAGEPRSALVLVSYAGGDRAQVKEVVHDIGAIILETQAGARSARMRKARDLNAAQAELTRGQLRALEQDRARIAGRAARSGVESAYAQADLAAIERAIRSATARVLDLDRRAASLELSQEAERQRLGLSFDLVDERVQTLRPPLGPRRLAAYALLLFPTLAAIAAIVLGSFDQRVYGAASVRSEGFPLLGTVPAFPGADAGSWRARAGRAE